jgi:integrase
MIEACMNSRDRAIIALFYEAALRPCEIGRMTWNDVYFDDYGVLVTVCEKTNRVREIRCVVARPYLAAWRDDCPYTPEGEAMVFCSLRAGRTNQPLPHMPLNEVSLREQIRKIAERAGVERYYRPYQFRHTRTTDLLNEGIPESHVMMITHGGRTNMLEVYSHVTAQDAQKSILAMNGIEESKGPKKKRLEINKCPHCKTLNGPTAMYCNACGKPLTEEARSSLEDKKRDIAEDKDTDEEMIRRTVLKLKAEGRI